MATQTTTLKRSPTAFQSSFQSIEWPICAYIQKNGHTISLYMNIIGVYGVMISTLPWSIGVFYNGRDNTTSNLKFIMSIGLCANALILFYVLDYMGIYDDYYTIKVGILLGCTFFACLIFLDGVFSNCVKTKNIKHADAKSILEQIEELKAKAKQFCIREVGKTQYYIHNRKAKIITPASMATISPSYSGRVQRERLMSMGPTKRCEDEEDLSEVEYEAMVNQCNRGSSSSNFDEYQCSRSTTHTSYNTTPEALTTEAAPAPVLVNDESSNTREKALEKLIRNLIGINAGDIYGLGLGQRELRIDFKDLRETQRSAQTEIDLLKSDHDEMKSQLFVLKAGQDELRADVEALKTGKVEHDEAIEDIQSKLKKVEELDELLRDKSKKQKKEIYKKLKLDRWYDAMIWQFFNVQTVDEYEDKLRHFTDDFFVIHFVLLSAVIALSAAYIVEVIMSGVVISSWIDVYEILVVLIAGNSTGFMIADKISVWCFKHYPSDPTDLENPSDDNAAPAVVK